MRSEDGSQPYLRGQMGQALAVEALFDGKSSNDRFFVEAGLFIGFSPGGNPINKI
jgi:hypothetical protein